MVKAAWAVACLLLVAMLLLQGCGSGNAARKGPAEGGSEKAVATDNIPMSTAAPGGAAHLEPAYTLGPEDLVRVSVWDNKDLTLDLVVRPDGKISLPLIQDVQAEGLTATELADQIRAKLTDYIKDPVVAVIVLQVNAPRYFVIGNVVKPGTYSLRSETSVLQALALAGGLTPFASTKMRLVRNIGGKQEVRTFSYDDISREGGVGNYILKNGDTIVVP